MSSNRLTKQDGTALIYVILVVSLLTGIIVNFLIKTKEYGDKTGYYEYRNKAYYIALSGVKLGGSALAQYGGNPQTFMMLMSKITAFSSGYPMLGGTLKMELVDGDSKFDINRLVYPNGSVNQNLYNELTRLFTILGIPGELLQDIIIFSQKDTLNYQNLESSSMKYTGMAIKPPIVATFLSNLYKNPFISIRDLMLVPGMRYKYYYILKNFLTVYSSGNINLNTAPYEVIESLSPLISDASAKELVVYRLQNPLLSVNQIINVPGFNQEILTQIINGTETSSNLFVINSEGIYNNTKYKMSEFISVGSGQFQKIYLKVSY